jgi:RHS repeat-associated protein
MTLALKQFSDDSARRGKTTLLPRRRWARAGRPSGPARRRIQAVTTNAAGQATDELAGNGFHTLSNYDSITGRLNSRTTGASSQIQNLSYLWDKAGNLTQRRDVASNLTEGFIYDNLYRVTSSTLNSVNNLTVSYAANGNISSKSDVGSYTYPTQGVGSVRPHAVSTASTNAYGYDANGNMTSRNGQATTWASYNLPTQINKTATTYAQFSYGASRARYKQVSVTATGQNMPAGTETTIYIGSLFEKVTKPSAVTEYKHTILAGGEAIAIKTLRSNSVNDVRYLHKDHLGSVDAVTSDTATLVSRFSFDAFGKRRAAGTWSGTPTAGEWSTAAGVTHRAFTYHEQLDNVDLVHMNGRVYDPNIGRFLSADPIVQAPLMSQSLNRYSYVLNNPLSLVDPSGFSWLSKLFKSTVFRTLLAIVVAIALPQLYPALQSFWGAVAVGAIAGGIAAGNLRGALLGGLTAGLFYGAGSLGKYLGAGNGGVTHAILHGAAGCLSAVAGGGKCGQGALSASFADFGGAHVHNFGSKLANALMRGVLGGAASQLGGGRFGDGLYQGVAGYAFNEGMHSLTESDGITVKAKLGELIEAGYASDSGFSAEFIPTEGYKIDVANGTATVRQGSNLWTFDTSGVSGGGVALFAKKVIGANMTVKTLDGGLVKISGTLSFNRILFGVSIGATTTISAQNFVTGNSGLLGGAARAITGRQQQVDACAVDGRC